LECGGGPLGGAGITLLPLDAGPTQWATTALQLATTPTTQRDHIATTLANSPYTLTAATTRWTTLWTTPQ